MTNIRFTSIEDYRDVAALNEYQYIKRAQAAAEAAPASTLHYFRKMVKLRKDNPVLVHGRYSLPDKINPKVYAYTRTLENEQVLVLLNFSWDTVTWKAPDRIALASNALINTNLSVNVAKSSVMLKPYQAVVMKVN